MPGRHAPLANRRGEGLKARRAAKLARRAEQGVDHAHRNEHHDTRPHRWHHDKVTRTRAAQRVRMHLGVEAGQAAEALRYLGLETGAPRAKRRARKVRAATQRKQRARR